MKKGEITKAPVQTSFGWHVIRLDDTREASPPPFDSVKDRLVQIVEGKKFKAYTDKLVSEAKIEKTLETTHLSRCRRGCDIARTGRHACSAAEPAKAP